MARVIPHGPRGSAGRHRGGRAIRGFLQRLIRPGAPGAGDAAPAVHLAAFGKHPGWNDHIDDLGLETDRLVATKRILYLEGIGAAIDSGAWDKLHESQRVEGFNHVLLWRTAEDVVIARLWSSSDGKGRTRYPMIVCAQLRNIPLQAALERVLPVLEAVQRACQETTSADAVRAVLSTNREQLRSSLASIPADQPELVVPASAINVVAADPAFAGGGEGEAGSGGGGEGLLRILYQVEREMAAYLSIGAGGKSRLGSPVGAAKSRMVDLRPQQIRVPACGQTPGEVALRWMRFLLSMLDPATTIVLIVPVGEAWADLIVGEPVGSQFFCIRASPKSLPLTSDIPYTLDAAFLENGRRLLGSPLAGGDVVIRRTGGSGGAPLAGVAAKLGWSRNAKLLALGAGAAVVLGGLAVALRPSSSAPAVAKVPAPAPERPQPAVNRGPTAPGGASGSLVADAPAFDERPWQELCAAYQDWAGQFLRKLDAPRRARFAAEPGLAGVLACLDGSGEGRQDPWSIAGVERGPLTPLIREAPAAVKTPEGIRRTAEGLACIRAAAATLTPQGWTRLADLLSAGERFQGRGWDAGHDAITRAVRDVAPARGVDVAEAVDAVLTLAGAVESLERRWGAIEAAAGELGATDDPVLRAFGEWAGKLGAGAAGATPGDAVAVIRDIDRRLAEAEAVGADLAGFVRSEGWAYVDHGAFRRASRSHGALAAGRAIDAGLFRDWLFEAPSFPAPDLDADPRRRWRDLAGTRAPAELGAAQAFADRLRARLAETSRPAEARDTAEFERLERLHGRVAALNQLPWSAADRARIETESAAIARDADDLKRTLDGRIATLAAAAAQGFAQAADQLRERNDVTASAALNTLWRSRRDHLLAELEAAPGGGDAATLLGRSAELEGAIRDLDRGIPAADLDVQAAGAAWLTALKAEAAAARERVLESAIRELTPGGVSIDSAVGQEIGDRYREQLAALAALAGRAARLEGLLREGYSLSERRSADEETAGELAGRLTQSIAARSSDGLGAAFKPLLDRAGNLGSIAASGDRAQLAHQVLSARADAPEQALGAWRRLGELSWPADLAELEQERALREALGRVLGTLGNPARREALAAELAAQSLIRFERGALRLKQADQLDAALGQLSGLGLSAAALRDPRLKFNALLYGLRGDLGATPDMPEDRAAELVERFVAEAGALAGAELGSRAAAKATVESLAQLASAARERARRPDAAPPIDFSTLGPGKLGAGWTAEVRDAGAEVMYRRAPHNGGDAIELRFVQVVVPGAAGEESRAAYLMAEELSLGQFIAIMATLGDWEDVAEFLRTFTGSTDPRLGPRVWEWHENTRGPVLLMRASEAWLRRSAAMGQTPYYPEGLDPGRPSLDHPLQQIPPDAAIYTAALVGCRLPTGAEWLAAHAANTQDAAPEKSNLRDAQWSKQRAYVDEVRRTGKRPEWPDDGVFWPEGLVSDKTGREAEANGWDDGALWLRPVAAGAEGRMTNLVGNVAEYVFDDPAVFAGLAAPDPEAISRLLGASADRLGVVGGSALSAPEIPVDVVQAIDLGEALELGYADVGVRFAFAADGAAGVAASLAASARMIVKPGAYLLPE